MTELFLVRHGQTEWSRDGRHTSVTDLPLTEHGREQALRLYGRLDPGAFGLALTSPRHRAQITAELAGFVGPHAPEVDEDLVEWFYGDYEGLTSAQIHKDAPGWTVFTAPPAGGETAEQVGARLDRVVDRVRSSGVERAIVFSHGHALRSLMLRWLGLDLSIGDRFPLDTSTVSILGEAKGRGALRQWNAPPE
ncbi:histidine phosphatase family protein [Microlunatus antarcticus]|uniref:Putative phosphoglycerate mutase n=1 Tax=Microlunatus antarcticus TaxID=53388 RepID=A0A7W5JY85_9ACTN|nr:histidine phosphatase family protein [Microlunatus antarcticus]MBB3328470.1 putative phosphoglycerate mutase [Microlunatus antarcticus]